MIKTIILIFCGIFIFSAVSVLSDMLTPYPGAIGLLIALSCVSSFFGALWNSN